MDLGLALYETHQVHTSGKPAGLGTCHLDRIHTYPVLTVLTVHMYSVVTPYQHIQTYIIMNLFNFLLKNHPWTELYTILHQPWMSTLEGLGELLNPEAHYGFGE